MVVAALRKVGSSITPVRPCRSQLESLNHDDRDTLHGEFHSFNTMDAVSFATDGSYSKPVVLARVCSVGLAISKSRNYLGPLRGFMFLI